MKRVLLFSLIAFAVLLGFSGCSAQNPDDGTGLTSSLALEGPDGVMPIIFAAYYPEPTGEPENSFRVIAHTGGRYVFDSLWLSFSAFDNSKVGKDLNLRSFSFMAALSSDSRNSTDTFSGRIILKEMTADKVVIQFKHVRLSIAHGNYHINGTMVAEKEGFLTFQ